MRKARREVQAATFMAHLSLAQADPSKHIVGGPSSPNLNPPPVTRGGWL